MSKVESIRGWDALDLDNPAYAAIRGEQDAQVKTINSDMRELFQDTELGQRVLGYLMGWTVHRPTVDPNDSDKLTAFKGGQDDIVRCILTAIENSEEI